MRTLEELKARLDDVRDNFLADRPVLRPVAIAAVSLVLILLVANVVAEILVGGGSGSSSSAAAIAQLDRVQPGAVLVDDTADPKAVADPTGIGSLHAGVAVVARSEVEKVTTESGARRAPEGSTLIAFRLGDWACEEAPCVDWRTLDPSVVLDGSFEELPAGGDTFVVVVPPGTEDVSLQVEADGFTQSLSLRDGAAGPTNIALLGGKDREQRKTLDQAFRLAERTSMQLTDANGQVSDVFERDVVLEYTQRHFFFNGAKPSSPAKVFLVVNTYYTYVGQSTRYVPLDEVVFVDGKGRRYVGRDLDPSDDVALLGFEIPASVTKGTLEYGGPHTRTSTTGVSYTATLDEKNIPLSLG